MARIPFISGICLTIMLLAASQAASDIRITCLAPAYAAPGATIRIHGVGFSHTSRIEIGGMEIKKTHVMNDHLLMGVVPPGLPPGPVSVTVTDRHGRSPAWPLGILSMVIGTQYFVDETSSRIPSIVHLARNVIGGDVDRDGDTDILSVSEDPDVLLLNNGMGVFTDVSSTFLPGTDLHAGDGDFADLDGDGDLDLVEVNRSYENNQLYLNDGMGRFADASSHLPALGDFSRDAVCADFDNDGDLDIAVASMPSVSLLINGGTGTFADEASDRGLGGIEGLALDAGDIDNDGDIDLLLRRSLGVALFLNDGTAHFSDVTADRMPASPGAEVEVVFYDVDNDCDLDVYLPETNGYQNLLFMNTGNGTFRDETADRLPQIGDNTWAAEFGDVDGDGDPDLITASAPGQIRMAINDGSGRFNWPGWDLRDPIVAANVSTTGLHLLDVNNDGRLDLATAGADGSPNLLFIGSYLDISHVPVIHVSQPQVLAAPGDEIHFRITATDPDGDPVEIRFPQGLPPGSAFNSTNGWFQWKTSLADAGLHLLRIGATDGVNLAPVTTVPICVATGTHNHNEVGLLVHETGLLALHPNWGGFGLYDKHSSNKHVWAAGPWVGARRDNTIVVAEVQYKSEFVPSLLGNTGQRYRVYNSMLPKDKQAWPPEFSTAAGRPDIIPGAQNLVVQYNDGEGVPLREVPEPLGVEIRQRSLAYPGTGLGDVIVLRWEITNMSGTSPLEDLYFGFWMDADIGQAHDDRAGLVDGISITWDVDFQEEDFGEQPAIVGFTFLETPEGVGPRAFSLFTNGPPYPDPQYDALEYSILSGGTTTESDVVHDVRTLLSSGPYSLSPGESIVIGGALLMKRAPTGTTMLATDPTTYRPDPADPVLADLLSTRRNVQEFYTANLAGRGLPKPADEAPDSGLPSDCMLEQNYPNPFNPETEIRFALPEPSEVIITIADPLGREVRSLIRNVYAAGRHAVQWDGRDDRGMQLPTGVYFCILRSGQTSHVRKMMLLR